MLTKTQVLTSSGKRFVDVRVLLAGGDFPQNQFGEEISSRLEWGFAGTSEGTKAVVEKGKLVNPAHTIWTHWVDSKSLDITMDDGYMYDQENGDVLELGSMAHPDSNIITKYEEVWKDLDIEITGTDDKRNSAVLRYDGGPEDRGMVIRVGQFIQGVRRKSHHGEVITSVARWQWINNAWHRLLVVGACDIPCPALFFCGEKGHQLFADKAGGVGKTIVGADEAEWECIEAISW